MTLTEVPRGAMWPVRHDLHHDAAEPRSIGARAAIIDRSKRQQAPRLARIRLSGRKPRPVRIKGRSQRNR